MSNSQPAAAASGQGPPRHTHLESLLLFEAVLREGVDAAAWPRVSNSLSGNVFVRGDDSYDEARLKPGILQSLFFDILHDELAPHLPAAGDQQKGQKGQQHKGQQQKGQQPQPKPPTQPKHKDPNPLKTLADNVDKLPLIVNRLWERYRAHKIGEVRVDEAEYDRIQHDLRVIEKNQGERLRALASNPPQDQQQQQQPKQPLPPQQLPQPLQHQAHGQPALAPKEVKPVQPATQSPTPAPGAIKRATPVAPPPRPQAPNLAPSPASTPTATPVRPPVTPAPGSVLQAPSGVGQQQQQQQQQTPQQQQQPQQQQPSRVLQAPSPAPKVPITPRPDAANKPKETTPAAVATPRSTTPSQGTLKWEKPYQPPGPAQQTPVRQTQSPAPPPLQPAKAATPQQYAQNQQQWQQQQQQQAQAHAQAQAQQAHSQQPQQPQQHQQQQPQPQQQPPQKPQPQPQAQAQGQATVPQQQPQPTHTPTPQTKPQPQPQPVAPPQNAGQPTAPRLQPGPPRPTGTPGPSPQPAQARPQSKTPVPPPHRPIQPQQQPPLLPQQPQQAATPQQPRPIASAPPTTPGAAAAAAAAAAASATPQRWPAGHVPQAHLQRTSQSVSPAPQKDKAYASPYPRPAIPEHMIRHAAAGTPRRQSATAASIVPAPTPTPSTPVQTSPANSVASTASQSLVRGFGTKWAPQSTPSTPGPLNDDPASPAYEPVSPPPRPATISRSVTTPVLKQATPGQLARSVPATRKKRERVKKLRDATGTPSGEGRRRSESVASGADELSLDHMDNFTKVKDEESTPRPHDETPAASRILKRKRQETPPAPPGPPSEVLWTRGFTKVSSSALDQISSHRDGNMFATAVREKDAPNYRQVVLQPQDITSIRSAIKQGNKAAVAAAAALPGGGDPGTASVWLPMSADLVPPRGIINSAQLERELVHMFCNAIMYNPDPDRGPGAAFMRRSQEEEEEVFGYRLDENGVVRNTQSMFVEVEKLLGELRSAERERTGPPPPAPSSSTPRPASSLVATPADDTAEEEDELAADNADTATPVAGAHGAVKRRRTAMRT